MKMALSFNTKPQNEIFITSLFDVNKKCKIPQGNLPPLPPKKRVTHPQQRWNTHGEQQPWFRILPPDGAQEESILAINIQHSNKKGKYRERINRSSTSHTNTPTHNHANSFKTHYKFIAIYGIQQKRNFISMSCSRKERMTGKQLYEANHLYTMDSNNCKITYKKTTT